jgi:hypothetical protein
LNERELQDIIKVDVSSSQLKKGDSHTREGLEGSGQAKSGKGDITSSIKSVDSQIAFAKAQVNPDRRWEVLQRSDLEPTGLTVWSVS